MFDKEAVPESSAADELIENTSSHVNIATTHRATDSIFTNAKEIVSNSSSKSDLKDDNTLPKRDSWTNHTEFILSMVGTCVGLGNVWRFPYSAYKNGGGAFLVPYLVAVVCAGIPIFLLEVSLGQYFSRGPMNAWAACPPFKGIGIAGTVMCYLVNIYYIIVISWILFYFWHSLTLNIPWNSCLNTWNQDTCVRINDRHELKCTFDPKNYNQSVFDTQTAPSQEPTVPIHDSYRSLYSESLGNEFTQSIVIDNAAEQNSAHIRIFETVFNYDQIKYLNENKTSNGSQAEAYCIVNGSWVSESDISEPVREFWERKVLKLSSGLDDVGSLNVDMTVTLVVTWIICYFCIWKGIRWTGKIVYFTALMPYVLLLVLLIQSLSLPGALTGLKYLFVPDVSRLIDYDVWLAAFSQVFYSYALAFGSLVTFGSYNKFHTNCLRDTVTIAVINSCTSLLSGVIVFSVIGFMSVTQNKPVEEVAVSGPGLAFIVYPSATNEMVLPTLWSTIFFFTLFMIGLDSEFCFVESFITAMTDQFPHHLRGHKELFTLAVCVSSCLLGLTCVTEGGIYVFQLMDSYACSGMVVVFLVFWSSVSMGWFYGGERWALVIKSMIGYHPGKWWIICWKYIVPLCTFIIFCINAVKWKPLTYVNYEYTFWGNMIGWILALSSMLWVPVYFIYYVITCEKDQGSFKQNLVQIFRPGSLKENFSCRDDDVEAINKNNCISTAV